MAPLNRSKPMYVKLNRMAPETHDHNIVVKVLEKTTVIDKKRRDGTPIREEDILVADETGCMVLKARNQFGDELALNKTVAIRNARVKLVDGHMRLVVDKWGSINDTTIAIPGDAVRDPNFSDVVYSLVTE